MHNWRAIMRRGLLVLLVAITALHPLSNMQGSLSKQVSSETIPTMSSEDIALTEKLDSILMNEKLDGSVVGMSVRNARNGDILFSHNDDIRLHPASNMKILTSVAALETLGTDYKFSTEVFTDGSQDGQELHGNLYLKGKGDPTLMEDDLVQLAKDLKAKGINKIYGDLIGDDSWYDDIRLSQDLNWSDEPFHTGAQVSALTLSPDKDFDAGTIKIEVTPNTAEEKATIRISPKTDYITVVNQTKMVHRGKAKEITIEREHGNNRIIVKGDMPEDGNLSQSWVSVWEPTGYALAVFRKVLGEQGIQIIGRSEDKYKVTPEDAELLLENKSIPLSELLLPFMKLSNNGIGEVLTKEMGKVVHGEGSWEKGLEVIEDTLTNLGVNRDTILLRDGSGMSHKNLIPANALAQILFKAQDKSWFPIFKNSLPVAGVEKRLVGGTLRNRMAKEPVKGNVTAKTGSITGGSTLAGYVTNANGDNLIFTIMINNYVESSEAIRAIEDEIVTILATHEF